MFQVHAIVAASCIAASFTLAGNAITQSTMTIPALLVDFPTPTSPSYPARAAMLGRQWPLCWQVGNRFFRPLSTLSTLGYVFCAYSANDEHWRFFVVAALLGVGTIVHSAVNMQPLNDGLAALAHGQAEGKRLKVGFGDAEALARRWARWNWARVVFPVVGGALALSRVVG